MLDRHLGPAVQRALLDSPVVLVNGARQTGKSTLVQSIERRGPQARYVTLDDSGILAAARSDPAGFLAGFDGPVVIDEVQRSPELFPAIKIAVDRDRRPGRFLLTGSANILLLPRLSESLAGRMEILTLWPLSQGEIDGTADEFVDRVFASAARPLAAEPISRADLARRVLRGGYPEVIGRAAADRRRAWFGSYVTTILQRDVRDLANIEGLTALPRLLSLLAARSMALLNFSELSRSSAIPQSTLKRYLILLETSYLVAPLRPWSHHLGKRFVKSPKLVLSDTGLAAHLIGADEARLAADPGLVGPLLESFAVTEVRKQLGWSRTRADAFHYRTHAGEEVDILLEAADGRVVGVDVKAAATVGGDDFRGLRALEATAGPRFHRGIVLYTGRESIPFSPRLQALPISALWAVGR